MVNALIISENIEYSKNLLNHISKNNSILKISAIATNLSEGIKIINSGLIDLTLINSNCNYNIIIENLNNIEEAYKDTCLNSTIIISQNINLLDNYIILDSDNINTVLYQMNQVAKDILNKKNNSDLLNKINNELKYIGYNLSYTGTIYLSESIALMYTIDNDNNNLNKKIYPIIAKKYNKTINNIKCSITKATSNMFYECEENRLKDYFCFYNATQPKPKLVMYTVLNKLYNEQ